MSESSTSSLPTVRAPVPGSVLSMIEPSSTPQLVNPVIIAAFAGWNDAADSASAAIEHLETEWQAEHLASPDPEDFYDFQVNRPNIEIGADGIRTVDWPTTRLS